jgi:chemotaxis signal transduction protein
LARSGTAGLQEGVMGGRYLVCKTGERLVAVLLSEVEAVLPMPRLARGPSVPPPIVGFARRAGGLLPVLDLALLLGEGAHQPRLTDHLVVPSGQRYGLLVTRAEDIMEDAEGLAGDIPVPAAHSLNGCVAALLQWQGEPVHLLALERVVSAGELGQVASLTRAAAERAAAWGEVLP